MSNLLPSNANYTGFQGILKPTLSTTIPINTTTSVAINLAGFSLVGIVTPSALTGTAFTFLASLDGVAYVPLVNSSGAVSYTVAVSQYLSVNPQDFYGVPFIKIVSGTTETAARTINLSVKGI